MTDKERLEIIKFLRNSEKTVAPGMQPSELISRKDVDWLLNRIEELETQLSINTNNMKQLQKENERYKQALEEIRGLYPLRNVGYQVSEIRKIVIKALEGENRD